MLSSRILRVLAVATTVATIAGQSAPVWADTSSLSPMGWDDFSGNENWIDFDPSFGLTLDLPMVYDDVQFDAMGSGGLDGFIANHTYDSHFDSQPGASLGYAMTDLNSAATLVEMVFPAPVQRIGLLLSTNPVTTWALEAYDVNDVLLGSVEASMSGMQACVFLGLEDESPTITSVLVREINPTGTAVTIFDDIRYEYVPEPGSLVTLAVGACVLFRRQR